MGLQCEPEGGTEFQGLEKVQLTPNLLCAQDSLWQEGLCTIIGAEIQA